MGFMFSVPQKCCSTYQIHLRFTKLQLTSWKCSIFFMQGECGLYTPVVYVHDCVLP